MDAFCAALHAQRARKRAATGRDLFVWDGELYLETHRGTLTTQAWLKRANARAERRLRAIEILLASAPDPAVARELAPGLDAAWEVVLLHQFHDILPGSSIAAVYDDARAAYAALEAELDEFLAAAARALAARADLRGRAAPLLVLNPCAHRRSAVVRWGERRLFLPDLPGLGALVADGAAEGVDPEGGVETTPRSLRNAHLSATFDAAGRLVDLRARALDRPVNAVGPDGAALAIDRLVAYADRPRRWEAWNVDEDYTDRAEAVDGPPEAVEVVEARPLRGTIEVRRRFRASTLVQRTSLDAGARHLEVELFADWREERTLLRALFPTAIRARHATCGIQFGHLLRATHRNTSWDAARFEVPGHRWMDLSQPGLGLAVLDDGIYGRSCHENVLGLSLLRSPSFPDPGADRGEHTMRYGLHPHGGDWRAAGVPRATDEFAEGTVVVPLAGLAGGAEAELPRPFDLVLEEGDVEVACFKPAEDGRGRILRLVERHGGLARGRILWRGSAPAVRPVDLLERPATAAEEARAEDGATRFVLRPFRILSLRVGS
ncbi:MAG: glycoside hydrolase family 38 C-terminal domain-containing protein [Planctomycetota bacterium]